MQSFPTCVARHPQAYQLFSQQLVALILAPQGAEPRSRRLQAPLAVPAEDPPAFIAKALGDVFQCEARLLAAALGQKLLQPPMTVVVGSIFNEHDLGGGEGSKTGG